MAKTTQSTQRIAQVAAATDFSDRTDDKRAVSGAIQYAFIDVPVTADNVATDVIDLYEFPVGTIIYPELCEVITTDDMSSGTVTVDIGDAVDVDRYCDGVVNSAVGQIRFITPAIPDGYTNRHKMVNTGVATTTTTLVKLTFAALGATVEAGVMRIVLAYKCL
jgi:hypothetical protein